MSLASVNNCPVLECRAWINLLCPLLFSRLKKYFDGESISAALWKRDRTSAPCALEPSRSAKAAFLDLRLSIQPRSPVDSAEPCSSTISISSSFIDLVMSRDTLRVYCRQSCFTSTFPQSHHCLSDLKSLFVVLKFFQKKIKDSLKRSSNSNAVLKCQ